MIDLVFVPGLLCTAALWEHQTRHLGDLANVYFANVTEGDTISALADAVLATSPPKFALAGLSMGGIIAHEVMRKAPERVIKLALLDTSARADTAEQTQRRHALLAMADRGQFAEVTMTIMPGLVHPRRTSDATLTAGLCAMAAAVGVDAFRRQIAAIISRIDSVPGLDKYDCPTLVLCGREDAITPLEMHEEMAAHIPHSKLAVIEQCGHIATMEQPQATTALLRHWLQYE